jgi:hypothetical protein
MSAIKPYRYPLRLDRKDKRNIDEIAKASGRSIGQVLTLSIRKGLPLAREILCADSDKITNVRPLPDVIWRRIYSQKDEWDESAMDVIESLQSQTEPK